MLFERSIYKDLLEWKEKYSDRYSLLIEGPRRVGKTTLALEFAKREYKNYVFIDFSTAPKRILSLFDDVQDLQKFFLRISTEYHIVLHERETLFIFDEIQFFPKARQALKHLVKDGRYSYIETGSLISIHENVKNILIPSEEKKIEMHPMTYDEFMHACANPNNSNFQKFLDMDVPLGDDLNKEMMRDFRLYMAVGGMPQAVETYLKTNNLFEVDAVKKSILSLYEEDFYKIDPSGKLSKIFHNIPSQLALGKKRFVLSFALSKRTTRNDETMLSKLLDSKTVLISHNCKDPLSSLYQTTDLSNYKLYLADTGLFVSLLYPRTGKKELNDIYNRLLENDLPENLGFLFENAVAQTLASKNIPLFRHIFYKEGHKRPYELDFLFDSDDGLIPIEVKSNSVKNYKSLQAFCTQNKSRIQRGWIFSQKDLKHIDHLDFYPFYLMHLVLERNK